MKRTLSVLLACLGLLCGRSAAWAVSDLAGTGGAQFLKLGQGSARAMALGQAYVALAEGADAVAWNPAGLALLRPTVIGSSPIPTCLPLSKPSMISR